MAGAGFASAGGCLAAGSGFRVLLFAEDYIERIETALRLLDVVLRFAMHCDADHEIALTYFENLRLLFSHLFESRQHHRADFKRVLHQPVRLDRLDQLQLQI